jgi:histone deacetylase 1/2
MENANSLEYLHKIRQQVIENLSRTAFAPSVQLTDVPPTMEGMDDEADAVLDDLDEDENRDTRWSERRWDKHVEREGELSDSDDEAEASKAGVRRQPGATSRRNIMDYQNAAAADEDAEIAAIMAENKESDEVAAATGRSQAAVNGSKSPAVPAEVTDTSNHTSRQASAVPAVVDNEGDVDMEDNATETIAERSSAQVDATSEKATSQAPEAAETDKATKDSPAAKQEEDEEMAEGDTTLEDAAAKEGSGAVETPKDKEASEQPKAESEAS